MRTPKHNCLVFERRAIVSLSGLEAQRMFKPQSVRNYHASSDYQQVIDTMQHFLMYRDLDKAEIDAWWHLLAVRSRKLLTKYWCSVEGLAQALIDKGQISGIDAFRVMLQAFGTATGFKPLDGYIDSCQIQHRR
jgi:hypothetical protein